MLPSAYDDEIPSSSPVLVARRRERLKICSYLSSSFLIIGVVLIALSPLSDNEAARRPSSAADVLVGRIQSPVKYALPTHVVAMLGIDCVYGATRERCCSRQAEMVPADLPSTRAQC